MGIKRTAAGRIYYDAEDDRQSQVLGLLGQIGERLQRSDSEREELSRELQEYRRLVSDLEGKAAKAEKVVAAVAGKLGKVDQIETDLAKRHEAIDRIEQEQTQKISRIIQTHADVERRLIATENATASFESRIAETVEQQGRLNRKLEKMAQDKIRLIRKLERMEEIVTETQEAIRAKAMVLLTDQSLVSASVPALPPAGVLPRKDENGLDFDPETGPVWRRPVRLQMAVLAVLVVLSIAGGWFAALGFSSPARLSFVGPEDLTRIERKSDLSQDKKNTSEEKSNSVSTLAGLEQDSRVPDQIVDPDPFSGEPNIQEAPDKSSAPSPDPLSATDKELATAFDRNPEALGAQLNKIEPSTAQKSPAVVAGIPPQKPMLAATTSGQQIQPDSSVGTLTTLASLPPPAKTPNSEYTQEAGIDKWKTSPEKSPAGSQPNAMKPAHIRVPQESPSEKPRTRVVDISPDPTLPSLIKPMEEKALAGVPEAQHDLGALYTAGRGGVQKNYEKAAFWFGKAAGQGVANARYNLGVLYQQGLGVPKDMKEAIKWYRAAADLGHAEAKYNLGIAYIEGVGVSYDPEQAAAYFESAAAGGVTEAAYNLGLIHENGLLGKARPDEALLWYKKAADRGNKEAKTALDQLAKTLQISPDDLDRVVRQAETEALLKAGEKEIPEPTKVLEPGENRASLAKKEKTKFKSEDVPPPPPPENGVLNSFQMPEKVTAFSGSLDKVIISQIQDQLKDMGMYNGPSDGALGPMTADAIRSYQARNDLPVDGQATEKLLIHMLAREIQN